MVSRCGLYKVNCNKAIAYVHFLHAKTTCTLSTLQYIIKNSQQHADYIVFRSSEIRVNEWGVPDILKTIYSFEKLWTTHPATWCYIAEELHLPKQCHENLKCCICKYYMAVLLKLTAVNWCQSANVSAPVLVKTDYYFPLKNHLIFVDNEHTSYKNFGILHLYFCFHTSCVSDVMNLSLYTSGNTGYQFARTSQYTTWSLTARSLRSSAT